MKRIALAIMLVCGIASAQTTATSTTLDPVQVYTTGNLVVPTTTTSGSTWANGVYQDQLTCWAWGNPGYCGPNAIVRPDGNINFSFGMTDLYQVRAIADVLPNSGAGLRVNGYTFGFTAKNGNGWDGGKQDYLAAYVLFSGATGPSPFYKTYDLNSTFNWTTFKFDETFATPFASKDLKTVQYGIVGMDTNYWAGPYGPEVNNVNFNLKYSVDACAVNVLSSPTCPGYLDALAKLAPASTTTTSDPITTSSTSPTTTTTIVSDPVASTVNVTSSTTVGQPSVIAPVVSAPTSTSTSTSTASSTQTTKESNSSGGSTSLALSIISKNSERDAAGSAVAQSAMAQAQQAATQAQQDAANVASNAVSNSVSANAVSIGGQQSTGNGIRATSSSSSTLSTTSSSLSVGTTAISPQIMSSQQPTINSMVNNPTQNATVQTAPTYTQQNINTVTQTQETYQLIQPNTLTDRTNPLTDIVEGKQSVPQSNSAGMTGPVVNKNAQDNDIAGGVSINKMATAPTGYGDYLNFTMRDVAFYAPKEVYKNQRNVDNQRALRTLTSDSKHREMVEMQYAK